MKLKSGCSFGNIHSAAKIYMALPLFCFFGGFLRWYYSLIACAVLSVLLWRVLKSENVEEAYRGKGHFSWQTILWVFVFSMIWSYLGGMNGYYYQSTDWDCRNAIYFDLIQYEWPVIYDKNGQALVYYIGHWLPPASLAKLVQIITGSVRIGRFMGRMFLWGWSSIGLTIIILMIFHVVGAQTRKKRIAAVFLFVFFSGLDFLGGTRLDRIDYLLSPHPLHMEWWCPEYQYTSIMACLFWVFNQTIIPWMITLCFIVERNPRNYVFYCVACLLCGTLPCIGLVVLMIVKAAVYVITSIKAKKIRKIPAVVFSLQNAASFLVLFPIVASFLLTSNIANTGVITGNMKAAAAEKQLLAATQMQEKSESYWLQPIAFRPAAESAEIGGKTHTAKRLSPEDLKPRRNGIFSEEYLNENLCIFLLLEVGLYLLYILPDHWKDPIFYTILICFFVIPYFHIGKSNDFCMRVSVPGVFILMLYVNRFLLAHFPAGSTEVTPPQNGNLRQVAAILLAICFAFGTVTPCVELYRGIYHVKTEGTVCLEDRRIMTFNRERVPNNFACSNPEEHFFFKYLAG